MPCDRKRRFKNLTVDHISLCEKGVNPQAKILLMKSRTGDPMSEDIKSIQAELKKAQAEKDALSGRIDALSKSNSELEGKLNALVETNEVLQKTAKAQADEIQKMQVERDTKEVHDMVAKSLPTTGNQKIIDVLLKSNAEDRAALMEVFKGTEEAMSKIGLYEKHGHSGQGEEVSKSEKFDSLVSEYMKENGVQKSVAINAVLASNPELQMN